MNTRKSFALIGGILLAGVAVVILVFTVIAPYLERAGEAKTVSCTQTGKSHVATIQNNSITPAHTYAKTCDTLTVINKDNKNRLMAFGVHDHHVTYDGKTESELRHNGQFTVTLNKTGTYTYHDHFQDETSAEFTVTK